MRRVSKFIGRVLGWYSNLEVIQKLLVLLGVPTFSALGLSVLAFAIRSPNTIMAIIAGIWTVVIAAVVISFFWKYLDRPRALDVVIGFRSVSALKGTLHQGWYLSVVSSFQNNEQRSVTLEPTLIVAPRTDAASTSRVRGMYAPPPVQPLGTPDLTKFLPNPISIAPDGTDFGEWYFHLNPLVMGETGMTHAAFSLMRADRIRVRDIRSGRVAEFAIGSDYPSGKVIPFGSLEAAVALEEAPAAASQPGSSEVEGDGIQS